VFEPSYAQVSSTITHEQPLSRLQPRSIDQGMQQ